VQEGNFLPKKLGEIGQSGNTTWKNSLQRLATAEDRQYNTRLLDNPLIVWLKNECPS
jgi:hypothetical protein